MELLLNLCWVLLVVAAFWMWQRQPRSTRHANPLTCLLALSCVLVLLFPVISESDDLHAMRQELEETNCKVKAGENEKGFHSAARLHVPPALVARSAGFNPLEIFPATISAYSPTAPAIRATTTRHDRAPPIKALEPSSKKK